MQPAISQFIPDVPKYAVNRVLNGYGTALDTAAAATMNHSVSWPGFFSYFVT
jgi:hypothetical protein